MKARPRLFVAEPPPAYAVRPPLVADCSVIAAWLFEETGRDAARAQLVGRTLHAPALLDFEFASVALKKQAGGWPPDVVDAALTDYERNAITLHRTDLRAQCALAARYGLSAYDAAYLWLAGELGAPLATFDRQLAEAARAHLAAPD